MHASLVLAAAPLRGWVRRGACMDEEVQQQIPDEEVQESAFNYAFMLQNLMVVIQEYLFLSDDNKECAKAESAARAREEE